jgi:hypothetical protein
MHLMKHFLSDAIAIAYDPRQHSREDGLWALGRLIRARKYVQQKKALARYDHRIDQLKAYLCAQEHIR